MNFQDYYLLQTESIDKRIKGDRVGEYAELAEENDKRFSPTMYISIPIAASKEKLKNTLKVSLLTQ